MRSLIFLLLAAVAGFADIGNGLSLKMANETAPAGAVVQMKLRVTEPKPIFTGSADFSESGFSSYEGLALNSPADDAAGVALMRAGGFRLSILSLLGAIGTNPDYPVFTFAARVNPAAANGAKYAVTVDPGAFLGPFRFGYPVEVKSGTLTVGQQIVISDVTPGSSRLSPGETVVIRGQGFLPNTRIKFKETDVVSEFVSSTEMRVRPISAADMHGMMVKATNRDGTSSTYYSYQRTLRGPATTHPVLARCEPIFARRTWGEAVFASQPGKAGQFFGFAFQNLSSTPSTVTAELRDLFGRVLDTGTVTVAPNTRIVRAAGELVPAQAAVGAFWRFVSTVPVQMLGIAGDASPEEARPIAPLFAR